MKLITYALLALAAPSFLFAMDEGEAAILVIDRSILDNKEEAKEFSVADFFKKYPNANVTRMSITSFERQDDLKEQPLTSLDGIQDLDYYPQINHFIFTNNAITLVGSPFKGKQSNCTIITLNSNKIPALPPVFFEGLSKLMQLELVNNDIEQLPADWGPLVHLINLNLRGNRLKKIREGSFAGLPKLVFLNLSNNQLELFELNKDEVPHLRALDLRENYLTEYRRGICTVCIDANMSEFNIKELAKAKNKLDEQAELTQELKALKEKCGQP